MSKKTVSPPDVVQTAYHTAKGAEYARKAALEFRQAFDCAVIVRDRVVKEGKGTPGTRHMDFGAPMADLLQLESDMYRLPSGVQQRQCHFNVEVLGNEPITQQQLLKYGGGGCR